MALSARLARARRHRPLTLPAFLRGAVKIAQVLEITPLLYASAVASVGLARTRYWLLRRQARAADARRHLQQ